MDVQIEICLCHIYEAGKYLGTHGIIGEKSRAVYFKETHETHCPGRTVVIEQVTVSANVPRDLDCKV